MCGELVVQTRVVGYRRGSSGKHLGGAERNRLRCGLGAEMASMAAAGSRAAVG